MPRASKKEEYHEKDTVRDLCMGFALAFAKGQAIAEKKIIIKLQSAYAADIVSHASSWLRARLFEGRCTARG